MPLNTYEVFRFLRNRKVLNSILIVDETTKEVSELIALEYDEDTKTTVFTTRKTGKYHMPVHKEHYP